jgi:DNA ligase 1
VNIRAPMLACSKIPDIKLLKFPLLASPKLDGFRCLNKQDKIVTRSFKPIVNNYVRNTMEAALVGHPTDGELMVKNASFSAVQSGLTREEGQPDFEYWVFDYVTDKNMPYIDRMKSLGAASLPSFCKKVLPVVVNNLEELLQLEQVWLAQGFEGVMLRSFNGPYKEGRSSFKEHYLMKLKQFKDSEARIIGFEELMSNQNEAVDDALGHSKRSSHKAGMVPANTMGKFVCIEIGDVPWKGKEILVGTGEGLTQALRKEIWDNQDKYLGKIINYRYQPHGVKDLPRIPIWWGFRSEDDL